jgi:hypothetical protein
VKSRWVRMVQTYETEGWSCHHSFLGRSRRRIPQAHSSRDVTSCSFPSLTVGRFNNMWGRYRIRNETIATTTFTKDCESSDTRYGLARRWKIYVEVLRALHGNSTLLARESAILAGHLHRDRTNSRKVQSPSNRYHLHFIEAAQKY